MYFFFFLTMTSTIWRSYCTICVYSFHGHGQKGSSYCQITVMTFRSRLEFRQKVMVSYKCNKITFDKSWLHGCIEDKVVFIHLSVLVEQAQATIVLKNSANLSTLTKKKYSSFATAVGCGILDAVFTAYCTFFFFSYGQSCSRIAYQRQGKVLPPQSICTYCIQIFLLCY